MLGALLIGASFMTTPLRTAVHDFPLLAPAQSQKHITVNEALQAIDARLFLSFLSVNANDLPSDAGDGSHVAMALTLPVNNTPDLSGYAGKIAYLNHGAWQAITPQPGWLGWDEMSETFVVFDSVTGWKPFDPFAEITQSSQLGINTAASHTNRLTVKSDAVLFSHDDVTPGSGDMRLNINKNSSQQVATFAFQTNYVTHAEFGTVGTDNTTLRVSADGVTFLPAIEFDNVTADILSPLKLRMSVAVNDQPAFQMTGTATDGSQDNIEGVGLYLTHNQTGNRQFALLDTETKRGVRFIDASLSGYEDGNRLDLTLGTSTHGVHVNNYAPQTQFSVSNQGGLPSKTVCAIIGDLSQSGDLLHITTSNNATPGDSLQISAEGITHFGHPPILPSFTIENSPPPTEGSLAFFTNLIGGGAPAYADGVNWRKMDGSIIV